MGDFFTKSRKFFKIFGACGAQIGNFSPLFEFLGAFGAVKLVTLDQKCPPFGHWPPQFYPWA